MKWLLPVFFIIFSFSSFAKKFATDYISFDLLNNWHCHPEGTEWICTNKLNRKKASEAMIILTAKQKGPPDSLAQYINHLKRPRTVKSLKAGKFTSKVFHAKQRQINQHMWIDGFHHGSEVPTYYTRYLVTTKGNLAILVTYSAHKNHYKKYASDFAASISSLKVMNVSADFASKQRGGSMGMGSVQDYIQDMIDADDELGGVGGGGAGGNGKGGILGLLSKPEVLGGLGLLIAILVYLFLKKKKKKKKKRIISDSDSSRRDKHGRHRSSRSNSGERRRRSSSSRSSSSRSSSSRSSSSRRRR